MLATSSSSLHMTLAIMIEFMIIFLLAIGLKACSVEIYFLVSFLHLGMEQRDGSSALAMLTYIITQI